ncbi:MAG: DUF2442 domain-containing protein [Candidatus Competibacter sp.]|nr:DUF2442 domain-containing protein [Candidatus Competibacter sp.]MDG4583266.1 DUF2442 domain-containing protein [Candidatus Competibacter sp.]
MDYDVIEAQVTGHLTFRVRFADGLSGSVRLAPSHLHGVFSTLVDPAVFAQLCVTDGFVSWPGEIDLAPDAMHAAIRERGEWVLR